MHNLLTIEAGDELLKLHTKLLQHEPFFRAYVARLGPARWHKLFTMRRNNAVTSSG